MGGWRSHSSINTKSPTPSPKNNIIIFFFNIITIDSDSDKDGQRQRHVRYNGGQAGAHTKSSVARMMQHRRQLMYDFPKGESCIVASYLLCFFFFFTRASLILYMDELSAT